MPKRSRKAESEDVNVAAHSVVELISRITEEAPTKNPAAVALGRMGGLKGGPARSAKMSKKARIASAKKAANARWKKG